MTPNQAGFTGKVSIIGHSDVLQLKRGRAWPDIKKGDFRNELLWYEPLNSEPRLLFCNDKNQIFELSFTPVES